jgi:hypothetical protein
MDNKVFSDIRNIDFYILISHNQPMLLVILMSLYVCVYISIYVYIHIWKEQLERVCFPLSLTLYLLQGLNTPALGWMTMVMKTLLSLSILVCHHDEKINWIKKVKIYGISWIMERKLIVNNYYGNSECIRNFKSSGVEW